MGVPPNHQKLMRRDLSIEPMVTWGSLILRTPCMHIYICIKLYKGWGPLGVYNCSSRGPPLYQSNYLLRQKKMYFSWGSAPSQEQLPVGGNTAPAFCVLKKKVVFAKAKLLIHSPK